MNEAAKAEFKQEAHGAVVATILESDNSIVEVMKNPGGGYQLIIHSRDEERDRWDDLTAHIEDKHLEMLGSLAAALSQGKRALSGLERIRDFRPEGEMPDIQIAAFAKATAHEILKGH